MQKSRLLLNEFEKLLVALDEHINFFCQRIEFMTSGQIDKARFIDEKVLPIIDSKIKETIKKIEEILSNQPKNTI